MRKKRILLLLSTALMLSLSPHAFAATKMNTKIKAACQLPDVSVKVPSTGQVFINPYEMSVEIDSTETDAQIVSTPTAIENETIVPIRVDVTVTGKVKEGSDMTLSTSPVDSTLTRKKAFVYFEMVAANSSTPDPDSWASEFDTNQHLAVRTSTRTRKNMVVLAEGGEDGCFGAFRLAGSCAAAPKIAWTEADGIDVEIAFTFHPMSRQQG